MTDQAKIIKALQCDEAYCVCHRDGAGEHSLHCPAHEDRNPSLSLSTRNDQLLVHCHAGCTQDAVINALRERSLWGAAKQSPKRGGVGSVPSMGNRSISATGGLTLAELAQAKRLPVDFLFDLGVDDDLVHGRHAVNIPYLNEKGEIVAVRYRLGLAKEAQRFSWRRQDRPILYGINKLPEIRKAGWVLLVEGESDVWTLRYHGVPTLGIPGKSSWQAEWAAHLVGLQVYLWQEPDAADLAARLAASFPNLHIIAAPSGIKDPSEAHLLGHDLAKFISELRASAKQVEVKSVEPPKTQTPITLYTSNELLHTEYPDPVWAVPGLLPTGLAILAGAPKIGKSWLALQIAFSVASGGIVFNEQVARGAILYLALEDNPRRLQARMKQQKWCDDLPAFFMCMGNFEWQIGDLRDGGIEKLSNLIEQGGYRLVVIDTLSRAVYGDQNDAYDMTRGLKPLHEMAHANNTALLLIDHHRKSLFESSDVIADISGSTAKGAVPDTLWGLYRERGKREAKLSVSGREIGERTLRLTMDWVTGCWQLDGEADEVESVDRRSEILATLTDMGEAQLDTIAEAIGRDPSNTHRRLQDLVSSGLVARTANGKHVFYRANLQPATTQ